MMHYRHALCLYPYMKDQEPGINLWPPTGLEYIATALQGHVEKISLVDLRHERNFHSPARMADFIRSSVDLVCVSIYWKARYKKVCDYVRQLPSDRPIIVGGREATDNVEDIFERCPNVSGIVRGEGEQTIQEIADGKPWGGILGLSYRDGDRIVHNANRPLQPIEEIKVPDRTLRRSQYYPSMRGVRLLPVQFDTILSSRGCPYHCKFCSFSMNPLGQKRNYVARSPESVVDEIEASPAEVILFGDDNFFVQPKRVERICDLLIERGIKKRFTVNARIEVSKHPQLLEKAYRAGFRMLLFGLESASDKTLENMSKGFTVDQMRDAFKVFRRFPFFYHGYFIFGNVGETEEEMLSIADLAIELGVHTISLNRLRVDKFTPLRKEIEGVPGYRISANGYVYSPDFDRKRLLRIRDRIRNRFIYRPKHIARMLSTMNACEIISYRDMLMFASRAPLFLYDYLLHLVQKAKKGLRARRKRSQSDVSKPDSVMSAPEPLGLDSFDQAVALGESSESTPAYER
jgi:anaerobic magnesium-protoporphyrin IX monomethyl ester cyclase